jgi:glycosyltransferase involved in cell wall biosynthesis
LTDTIASKIDGCRDITRQIIKDQESGMRRTDLNSPSLMNLVGTERGQWGQELSPDLYDPWRQTQMAERSATATSPIRVLMVTSEWPTQNWAPNHFIARQASFLKSSGVDLDVFHFRGAKKPFNYLKAWVKLQTKLARGSYDLVHAQFGQSALLALPKHLPLVVTFRGDDLQGIIGDYEGHITSAGKILRRLCKMIARYANAVIVVSEHMKSFLDESIPAHVIPSGIDFELFRCIPQDEARRHIGLPLERRLVLFVGRTTEARKRYELARQAVEILNRSLSAELFVGWGFPHSEIPFLLNACDVLVCTSLQEGSPNAVKEALACNLPVVSVPVADVPMRLKGIPGCEVCADDRPESIAAALERVLRRGERIEGRQAVRNLDEQLLTRKLISIYQSILADTGHQEAQI